MRKLKRNDKVIVIAGKYKGKTGPVIDILRDKRRVKVEGVAIRTMHKKPARQGEKGEIVKSEGYIDISNVMPISPDTNKPCRVNKMPKSVRSKDTNE